MVSSFSCKVSLRLFLFVDMVCFLALPIGFWNSLLYANLLYFIKLKTNSVFPSLLLKLVLPSSRACVPWLPCNWPFVICDYMLGAFVLLLCLYFQGSCVFHMSLLHHAIFYNLSLQRMRSGKTIASFIRSPVVLR